MKCIKYEDMKIADIETITKTGFITEMIFDADTKTINIKDDELKEAEKKIGEIVNAISESFKPVMNALCEVAEKVASNFVKIRRKFIEFV